MNSKKVKIFPIPSADWKSALILYLYFLGMHRNDILFIYHPEPITTFQDWLLRVLPSLVGAELGGGITVSEAHLWGPVTATPPSLPRCFQFLSGLFLCQAGDPVECVESGGTSLALSLAISPLLWAHAHNTQGSSGWVHYSNCWTPHIKAWGTVEGGASDIAGDVSIVIFSAWRSHWVAVILSGQHVLVGILWRFPFNHPILSNYS